MEAKPTQYAVIMEAKPTRGDAEGMIKVVPARRWFPPGGGSRQEWFPPGGGSSQEVVPARSGSRQELVPARRWFPQGGGLQQRLYPRTWH